MKIMRTIHELKRPLAGFAQVALLLSITGSLWGIPLAAAQERTAPKAPEPEVVNITTEDGVTLTATFYPGTNGKESVPVVMLHTFKGSRGDWESLATMLQHDYGHAILVPDLRGHGDSTTIQGAARPLEAERLRPEQLGQMVTFDMKSIKEYLRDKNNARELNLDMLCLVGAEMGAAVALNFAVVDWNEKDYGKWRHGRFVKALVLMSPEWDTRGLRINQAVAYLAVRQQISFLLIAGNGIAQALKDTERLATALRRSRPDPPADSAATAERTLYVDTFPTKLQGTKLLGAGLKKGDASLEQRIAKFIDLRVVNVTPKTRWTELRADPRIPAARNAVRPN